MKFGQLTLIVSCRIWEFRKVCSVTRQLIGMYAKKYPVSLRDIQRIASQMALLPKDFATCPWAYQCLGTICAVLKVFRPHVYQSIRKGTASYQMINEILSVQQHVAAQSSKFSSIELCCKVLCENPLDPQEEGKAGYAFGTHGAQSRRIDILRFLSEDIDIFHLPNPT